MRLFAGGLLSAREFLAPVFELFDGFARALLFLSELVAHESVAVVVSLPRSEAVVDEAEARRLSASVLGLEAGQHNRVRVLHFVQLRHLTTNQLTRWGRQVLMPNVHRHLFPLQQFVDHEFACLHSDDAFEFVIARIRVLLHASLTHLGVLTITTILITLALTLTTILIILA